MGNIEQKGYAVSGAQKHGDVGVDVRRCPPGLPGVIPDVIGHDYQDREGQDVQEEQEGEQEQLPHYQAV